MDTAGTSPSLIASDGDEPGRRTLTLARPDKANAVDLDLARALRTEVRRTAQDGCQALVVDAQGRNFCAGFDFSDLEGTSVGDLIDRFVALEEAFQVLRSAPFVSFALVGGAAFGAGADLAIACTYRIGTARARFRFPGFQFGVALGTRHLARTVGMQAARNILLRNRIVGAEEALEIGLLTHLVEDADVAPTLNTLAAETASLDPGAVARIHAMTAGPQDAADLSDLVRSLSEPGLKERIAAYRGLQS